MAGGLLDLFCGNESAQILQQDLNSSSFPLVNECIQHSWLIYIPCFYLLSFFPILLDDLHTSPNGPLKCQSPITYRLILSSIMELIVAVMLMNCIHERYMIDLDSNGHHLFGLLLLNLSILLSLVLLIACRNRGVVSSGVLFIFHALLAGCGLPELINHLHNLNSGLKADVHCHLYLIYYLFVVAILLLSCFADRVEYAQKETNACPELYTSFLNQITFYWFTGLTVRGYFKGLQIGDLWQLNDKDQAPQLVDEFESNYAESIRSFKKSQQRKARKVKEPKSKKECLPVNGASESHPLNLEPGEEKEPEVEYPSVLSPLARTFRWTLLAGAFYKLAFDVIQFGFPQLLRMLISFVEKGTDPTWYGVTIAVAMFAIATIQSLVLHQYFHLMFRCGMNIRSVLTAVVYKKAINLSNKARKNQTVGSIVNIMAADVQRWQINITTFVMLIWSAPFQMLLALFFLWRLLGLCVLIGLVILILLIPLNSWISSKTRLCQNEQMECKDKRLRLISEVMNGIKMIKLYGWEEKMQERILEQRQKEVKVLKKLAFLNACTSLSWSCAPFLVAVMTFGTYVLVDPVNNILTPQTTFVALSLFNILRFPMAVCVIVFTQVVQFMVSNKRVKAFLSAEELEPSLARHSDPEIDYSIVLENASYSWDRDSTPVLNNLNVQIKKGSLVAVIGRIGAGKSSLIQALIGEMHRVSGWSAINGHIAYVPQQAWIQNLSVRENILFGQIMRQDFYDNVLNACALTRDMEALPAGDLTEIGEKGINLSGGQKSRTSLARAVYADADVYLLDDPLASVDAHVGRSIFENIINGLLSKKTRLFITHSLVYLKHCNQIIVMKDGQISESGSYDELMRKSGEFAEILEEFLMEETKNRGRSISFGEDAVEVKEVLEKLEQISPAKKEALKNKLSLKQVEADAQQNHLSPNGHAAQNNSLGLRNRQSATSTQANKPAVPTVNPRARLIEGESIETGKVKWSVYVTYISAIGYGVSLFFLIIYFLSSGLGVKSNMWLADWSDEELQNLRNQQNNETSIEDGTSIERPRNSIYSRLGIYTLLGLGQAVFVCLAAILVTLGMVRASWLLHKDMLIGILRSPMSFFDVTPLGRILNRFAKDMDMIDSRLPSSVLNFTGSVIQAFAIVCVPVIVTPQVAIPLVLIAIVYLLLTVFYLSTSRQLKRLEAVTRSPIYSHFGESIQGATSIRAYECTDRFVAASKERVDQNLRVYYPSIVANRWLSIRLELIGNLIVFCSALFAVLFRHSDNVTAGLIGLSVSYAFNVTQTLNWAVRMSSELETNIVSVERIQEYANTETEKQINGVEGEISVGASELWPANGEIKLENLSLRYRDNMDDILHEISVHIQAGERVGIIGRTGSGKSTLALALLRIVEPSTGRILIDNINIAHVKLDTIRARLTVVPQDPVLFSGTIRSNLDPCDVFNQPDLWNALHLAHMGSFVESLPEQLNHQVSEGGSNLSVGQRQLICLARAMLRKPKILVLDEASASVDMETDSLIHRTIKEHFNESTVLIIAHRLNFMFDCDRILAMDAGRVVEFDTPRSLWTNETSVFRQLANESELPLANVPDKDYQIQTPNIEVTMAEVSNNAEET